MNTGKSFFGGWRGDRTWIHKGFGSKSDVSSLKSTQNITTIRKLRAD